MPWITGTPITEAVIELKWRDPIDFATVMRCSRKLASDYPNVEEQAQVMPNFVLAPGGGPTKTETAVIWRGMKHSSQDAADIARVTTQAFSSLRLAPYAGWDRFCDRAMHDWGTVVGVIGRRPVERIGLRYINRIDIPDRGGKPIQFDEYVTVQPSLPNLDGPPISAYLIQFNRPADAQGFFLTITAGTVVPPLLRYQSIMVDIEVHAEKLSLLKDEDIWEVAKHARTKELRF